MGVKTKACANTNLEYLLNDVADSQLDAADALWLSLHTQDPGVSGTQDSSEVSYPGYARVAVTRDANDKQWTVTNGNAVNASRIDFPERASGEDPVVVTHIGVGLQSSGAGQLRFRSALGTPRSITAGAVLFFNAGKIIFSEF